MWRALFHKTGVQTWSCYNSKQSDIPASSHDKPPAVRTLHVSHLLKSPSEKADEPQTSPRDQPETRLGCLFTPVSDRDPAPLSWKWLLPPPISRNRSLMWEFDWRVCLKWTWNRDVTKCSTVTIFCFDPWPLRPRGISVSKPIAHIRWSYRVRRAASAAQSAADSLFTFQVKSTVTWEDAAWICSCLSESLGSEFSPWKATFTFKNDLQLSYAYIYVSVHAALLTLASRA